MIKRICFYSMIILVLFICLACFSFSDSTKDLSYSKYSKKNHTVTFILNKSLYVEKYKVLLGGGGATTCDVYSCYITDSINFRKYIGEEDYCNNRIFWNIKDSCEVEFYFVYFDFDEINDKLFNDTIKIGSYSIPDLIKAKINE